MSDNKKRGCILLAVILVPLLGLAIVVAGVAVVALVWLKRAPATPFKREVVEWDKIGPADDRGLKEPLIIKGNPALLRQGGATFDRPNNCVYFQTLEGVQFKTPLCRLLLLNEVPGKVIGASIGQIDGKPHVLGAAPQPTVHQFGKHELAKSSKLMQGMHDAEGRYYLVYLDDADNLVTIVRVAKGDYPTSTADIVPFTPVFDHKKREAFLVVLQGVRLTKRIPAADMDIGMILGSMDADGQIVAPRANDGTFLGGAGVYSKEASPKVIDGIEGPGGARYVLFLNPQGMATVLAPVGK